MVSQRAAAVQRYLYVTVAALVGILATGPVAYAAVPTANPAPPGPAAGTSPGATAGSSLLVALPLVGSHLMAAAGLTGQPRSEAQRMQALAAVTPAPSKAQAVLTFAAANGLPVVNSNRWEVTVRVTPAQAARLFHTALHAVTSPLAPGKHFLAPTVAPTMPTALQGNVSNIVGLDTRPYAMPAGPPAIPMSSTTTGAGIPISQVGAAYNFAALGTGAGETVAIPELGGFNMSDLSTYAAANHLAIGANQIQVQTVDGGATPFQGGLQESALDTETLLQLAPQATQLIINAPNTQTGMLDAYAAIVQDETNGTAIQAVTTSWTTPDLGIYYASCEGVCMNSTQLYYYDQSVEYFGSMMATVVAGGATVFAASGDSGAYANSSPNAPSNVLAVNMPAEFPMVTGVGGTTLPQSLGGTETAWTTAASLSPNGSGWQGYASGGGNTGWIAAPSWQNVSMAANPGFRMVPDVAGNAGQYMTMYSSAVGGWVYAGGTSAAAPQWAAGLVDALSKGNTTKGLGNINPTLYANQNDFNKINQGGNFAYTAPSNGNYNMVTGIGSPNWALLGPALVPSIPNPPPPAPSGPALSGRIAVAKNSNGNAELFATDTHGNLVHSWACVTCAGGWSGWSVLASGGFVGTPSAHLDSTGRMEIAVRTTSGQLDVFWQNTPAAGPWDGPSVIGGGITSAPDLIAWPNGRLEVFAGGSQQVLHVWQNAPGVGNWSPELSVGGNIMPGTHVAIGMNSAGYPEVFATSTTGQLIHTWYTGVAPGGWSGWGLLQPQAVIGSPSVGQNADGRLEVFARAANNTLYHTWQNAPSAGPWYGGDLGGNLTSSPVVTQTSSLYGGNLDVFANSGGQVVVQLQQPHSTNYWSGWIPLGGNPSAAVSVGPNGDMTLAAPTVNGPETSNPVSLATWSQWQGA